MNYIILKQKVNIILKLTKQKIKVEMLSFR